MRIESLDLVEASSKREVHCPFRDGVLNVLITRSSSAAAIVGESILSALFHKSLNVEESQNGEFASCSLTVSNASQRVKLCRTLKDGSLALDFLEPKADSTQAFTESIEIGSEFSKLSLETFRSLCFVSGIGAGNTKDSLLQPDLLASLLNQSVYAQPSPLLAIAALDNTMQNYVFNSRTYNIEELLFALERGRSLLLERLKRMEEEKARSDTKLVSLNEMEKEIADTEAHLKLRQYAQLEQTIQDLDARIYQVQQLTNKKRMLVTELKALGEMSDFPVHVVQRVDELWSKRSSTLNNYERLNQEIQAEGVTGGHVEAFLGSPTEFDSCKPEDVQSLYGLAGTLESVQSELDELTVQHMNEMKRAKSAGVDFDKLGRSRQALLSMSHSDLEQAKGLAEQARSTKLALSENVQVSQRVERDVNESRNELSRAVVTERRWRTGLLWLSVSPVAFLIAVVAFRSSSSLPLNLRDQLITIFITTSVTAFLFTAFVFVLLHRNKRTLIERTGRLNEEYGQITRTEATLGAQLADIHRRADRLAATYKIGTGIDLLKQINNYAANADQLKDLDLLEQLISSREKQRGKILVEVHDYFTRTGRSATVVTPQLVTLLADDIRRYLDSVKDQDSAAQRIEHKKSELRFLLGEVKDIESQLRDAFYRARLSSPEELDQSIVEFRKRTGDKIRYEEIRAELSQLIAECRQQQMSDDPELELEKLITARKEVSDNLLNLKASNPVLFADGRSAGSAPGNSGSVEDILRQVEVLQLEYVECRDEMRSLLKNFQDYYPKTLHELEVLERNIKLIEEERNAAKLAKSLIEKVHAEMLETWSRQLSKFMADILKASRIPPIEQVSWDEHLRVIVQLKGTDRVMTQSDLKVAGPRSIGEQLEFLSHLAVAMAVCQTRKIPLILEEPFARVDDSQFLNYMRLLAKVAEHVQIIIVTCHHMRHQWLFQQLSQQEADRINLIPSGDSSAG